MPEIQYIRRVTVFCLTCSLGTAALWAAAIHSALPGEEPTKIRQPVQPGTAVKEWFGKYDQIRRDAEMTMAEKLQSLLLTAIKPEKENGALASRMIGKYTVAVSELEKLQSMPETKELQDGYIMYFSTARQLFADYLKAQQEVPFTNQTFGAKKKILAQLDRKNKRLDGTLRKQYVISKHEHS